MGASSRSCSRTLEITVISGENLHVDSNPVTVDAYVVVRSESISCCTTSMAKEGGTPSLLSWNEKFLLDMPLHARSITFEVQCKASRGARPLGVARIAVSDFLGGSVPETCLQVLSYRLRDWEGRRNGVIHFSVRVAPPQPTVNPEKGAVSSAEKVSPCEFMRIHVDGNGKNSGGVVTGIPIWWNYPTNS